MVKARVMTTVRVVVSQQQMVLTDNHHRVTAMDKLAVTTKVSTRTSFIISLFYLIFFSLDVQDFYRPKVPVKIEVEHCKMFTKRLSQCGVP